MAKRAVHTMSVEASSGARGWVKLARAVRQLRGDERRGSGSGAFAPSVRRHLIAAEAGSKELIVATRDARVLTARPRHAEEGRRWPSASGAMERSAGQSDAVRKRSHFARRPDGLRDEVLRQLPDVLERLPVVH